MDRPLAAFYLVLLSCAFGLSTFISRFTGSLIILATYIVFIATAVLAVGDAPLRRLFRDHRIPRLQFQPHPAILGPTVVLWVLFAFGLVLNPSPDALLRTGAFIVISGVTLFVVPAVVSREQAFTAIGVVGATFVVLGLPSALTDTPFRIAGITLSETSGAPIQTLGVTLHSPTAIFGTQNYFRVLVAIGAVASVGAFVHTRDLWLAFVCALNVLGVYLTLGRAARLATFVAAGLSTVYLAARRLDSPQTARRALAGVTLVGICGVVVGFAVGFGLVPGPTERIQAALGDRLLYWGAAFDAVLARPLVGWGLVDTDVAVAAYFEDGYSGVHNSYLRLFVIGGVVGGLVYLSLAGAALVVAFGRVADRAPLALTAFCLVVMALLFQLFAGGTVFGTSLSSVLWALTIGYAQPNADTELSPSVTASRLSVTAISYPWR